MFSLAKIRPKGGRKDKRGDAVRIKEGRAPLQPGGSIFPARRRRRENFSSSASSPFPSFPSPSSVSPDLDKWGKDYDASLLQPNPLSFPPCHQKKDKKGASLSPTFFAGIYIRPPFPCSSCFNVLPRPPPPPQPKEEEEEGPKEEVRQKSFPLLVFPLFLPRLPLFLLLLRLSPPCSLFPPWYGGGGKAPSTSDRRRRWVREERGAKASRRNQS